MAIKHYVNVTNTLYKIMKYCIMFAVVFLTLLTLPDCMLSFRNVLFIVLIITLAYITLDLMIPNTVVIKMQKINQDLGQYQDQDLGQNQYQGQYQKQSNKNEILT